jgi:hypothetical protein
VGLMDRHVPVLLILLTQLLSAKWKKKERKGETDSVTAVLLFNKYLLRTGVHTITCRMSEHDLAKYSMTNIGRDNVLRARSASLAIGFPSRRYINDSGLQWKRKLSYSKV